MRLSAMRFVIVATAASAMLGSVPAGAAAGRPIVGHATTVPVYTHRDSGRTLHLHVGDRFKVRLVTVTDGDFFWHYLHRPDAKIVKVVRKRIVAPKLAPGAVGGESHTVYTLKAVGSGRTALRLAYYQGTQRQKVAKRFRLFFRVR